MIGRKKPDLTLFEKWLGRISFVHEWFSAFKEGRKEDRLNIKGDKRFSKTLNFSAISNVKKRSQHKAIKVRQLMAPLVFENAHYSKR